MKKEIKSCFYLYKTIGKGWWNQQIYLLPVLKVSFRIKKKEIVNRLTIRGGWLIFFFEARLLFIS
jgi:hypothetical protein